MNLIQQRRQVLDKRQSAAEQARLKKLDKLVSRIETVMRDPDVITVLEKQLVESGLVQLKEFGCLCQGGFCDWQKGLTQRLQPLIQEWEAKGAQVIVSIDLILRVPPTRQHTSLNGNTLRYYFKRQNMPVPSHLNLKED